MIFIIDVCTPFLENEPLCTPLQSKIFRLKTEKFLVILIHSLNRVKSKFQSLSICREELDLETIHKIYNRIIKNVSIFTNCNPF